MAPDPCPADRQAATGGPARVTIKAHIWNTSELPVHKMTFESRKGGDRGHLRSH